VFKLLPGRGGLVPAREEGAFGAWGRGNLGQDSNISRLHFTYLPSCARKGGFYRSPKSRGGDRMIDNDHSPGQPKPRRGDMIFDKILVKPR